MEEQCEQAIYRQEQHQQKGRRETVGAMVQCTCSRREEKRRDKPAAAEAPAPFPREAAAGHDDVRRHERQQPGATRGATAATSGHCVRAAAGPLLLLISGRRLMRKSYHFMPHSKIIFFICWKRCIIIQDCENAILSQTLSVVFVDGATLKQRGDARCKHSV